MCRSSERAERDTRCRSLAGWGTGSQSQDCRVNFGYKDDMERWFKSDVVDFDVPKTSIELLEDDIVSVVNLYASF